MQIQQSNQKSRKSNENYLRSVNSLPQIRITETKLQEQLRRSPKTMKIINRMLHQSRKRTTILPNQEFNPQRVSKLLISFNTKKITNKMTNIEKFKTIAAQNPSIGNFLNKLARAYNSAIMHGTSYLSHRKKLCAKLSNIIEELMKEIVNMIILYNHKFNGKMKIPDFIEKAMTPQFNFLMQFQEFLQQKDAFEYSYSVLKMANMFYENHSVGGELLFHIYVLRKLTRALILFHLYEDALVYLNYLKELFNGDDYVKEFIKIYLSFGDCLLETNRLDYCLIYYKRCLYMSWLINHKEYELKIYDRISRYFFKKKDIKRSISFHNRFAKGTIEPQNSRYRIIGFKKYQLFLEKVRFKKDGTNDQNFLAIKNSTFSRRINISFECVEEDEDVIVDIDSDNFQISKNTIIDPYHLYEIKSFKRINPLTHLSVLRDPKNFLTKNMKNNRKRIIKDLSLANFKVPSQNAKSLKEIFYQLSAVFNIVLVFYEDLIS